MSIYLIQVPQHLSKPGGYEHIKASFGTFPDGGTIQQPLHYDRINWCDPKYDASIGFVPWQPPFILMVDRQQQQQGGPCTFVQKVRNAQRAGAAAVLIADDTCLCSRKDCVIADKPCQSTLPSLADDGSGGDVTIPSFLLYEEDASELKVALRKHEIVTVSIAFDNAPKAASGARVEYKLWTPPSNPHLWAFLYNFGSIAQALGKHAVFEPHVYIYDGEKVGCTPPGDCSTLCTNGGRYCAPDPDGVRFEGVSGADVVKESLRQICIWKRYGAEDGLGKQWWDYVQEFLLTCAGEEFISETCISHSIRHAGIDPELIRKCMEDSGGVEADGPNPLVGNTR